MRLHDLADPCSFASQVHAAFDEYARVGFPRPPDLPAGPRDRGPRPLAPDEVERLVRGRPL
jgi:hypothetical protein